jgi:very-short-patch-repair endonuclease
MKVLSYKKGLSRGKYIRTKETKEKISISRKGHISWMKGKHHTKEAREKIRIGTKLGMKINNSGEKISKALTGKKLPEEQKEKIRKSMKEKHTTHWIGRKHSEETKNKMCISQKGENNGMFGKHHTEEAKKRISILHKGLNTWIKGTHLSQETKQKLRIARYKQIFPLKDTSIEVKIQSFLKQLNIDFLTHQYIKDIEHGYQCDLLIPSMNLVIECDGDYWHKYPIGNDIDNIRTSELLEKGFKVLRLWEFEITAMDINKFKERLNGT